MHCEYQYLEAKYDVFLIRKTQKLLGAKTPSSITRIFLLQAKIYFDKNYLKIYFTRERSLLNLTPLLTTCNNTQNNLDFEEVKSQCSHNGNYGCKTCCMLLVQVSNSACILKLQVTFAIPSLLYVNLIKKYGIFYYDLNFFYVQRLFGYKFLID